MIKVLFLTDHLQHNFFDSVYLLASHLNQHPQIEVAVASISHPSNVKQIDSSELTYLWCVKPENNFSYPYRAQCFTEKSHKRQTDEFHFLIPRTLPIDLNLLTLLARQFDSQRIINNPMGMAKTTSKAYLLNLAHLCPKMSVCYTAEEALQLSKQFDVVFKHFYGFGGKQNILMRNGQCFDGQIEVASGEVAALLDARITPKTPYLTMEYLPRYHEGDKRTLIINGQIIGSSLRLPSENSWVCNVSSGGSVNQTSLTGSELAAIEYLTPLLREEGIIIYGIDTLVGNDGIRVISEINTFCVGGFYSLHTVLNQKNAMSLTVQALTDYMFSQDRDRTLSPVKGAASPLETLM